MQQSFYKYQEQCSPSDLAFFDLLKSIAELKRYESTLSALEISQLEVGAKVLNGLIARHRAKNLVQLRS